MATSDGSDRPVGPRQLLLHRFGSVALAALTDGASEDDLAEVLSAAVAAWRRRQMIAVRPAGRHLNSVPASG